ncbi:MAG: hypothetical protein DMG59_18005 [Acidobacteria bacterium]|nr:MAG: hypothetical protein DMG59_18005 [Acidobacteriota bacterium]
MRLISVFLFFASLVVAQGPRIGIIDFYGLRKVSEAKVRKALGVREGDPLPRSKGDAEERIDAVPGVVESHLEAVCCDAGKMILYVGIEEKGAIHFDLREPPEEDVVLPEEITSTYRRFMENLEAAIRRGESGDDVTHGHSLVSNPEARAVQEQFIPLAKDHLAELRNVLRNSSDEEQRATAAYVIGYAPKKREILDDLQYALKDPDSGVRNNAARNLVALAVLARLDPESGLKIEPTWFIEMLNSLSWTDRNKALWALQTLTDKRDPSVLEQLRDRALPALIEMARWKSLGHALPAYMLLGRIAGLPEQQLLDGWNRGDRDFVIAAVTAKKK